MISDKNLSGNHSRRSGSSYVSSEARFRFAGTRRLHLKKRVSLRGEHILLNDQ